MFTMIMNTMGGFQVILYDLYYHENDVIKCNYEK